MVNPPPAPDKMGNLAKRLATAAVLVPALLAVIYLDPTVWSVLAFATAVTAVAYDEYLRMALPVDDTDRARSLRLTAGVIGAGAIALPTVFAASVVLPPIVTLAAIPFGIAVLARPGHLARAGHHLGACLAGLIYVPVLMSVLPLIKRDFGDDGPDWLTVTLCMAFFSDTVAYFFGRAFGKRKLYEAVSPKKTRAGGVGGLVGSTLATVVVGSLWLIPTLPLHHAVILGLLASVVGQIGDLVESMIKRTFGVKDSGNLLPGHGGMLDRIDALLFVGPVVYYYVTLAVVG